MVGAGETSFADLAAERFGTGVFAVVPRQLVGARETPLTVGPVATVRFLPCMDSLMCLQVRALGVHFTAAGEIAMVDPSLLQFRVVPSVVLNRSIRW